MSGRKERNEVLNNHINNYLNKNKEKFYLTGYYYFLSNVSLTTAYQYLQYVNTFMNSHNKKIEELTVDEYAMFMNSIKKYTPSYQIAIYSALKKFSLYLQVSGKNNNNPMQYIPRPKAKEKQETIQKRERGYLTEKEIDIYINNIKKSKENDWKYRDLAIVLIFLNTGIRESALCQLDINDIDFVNNTLTVTDKGDKVIIYPLSKNIIKYLNQWIERRKKILDNLNVDALFISNQKVRMNQTSVYRVVKKYNKNIQGKELSPHKLRATYGTQLYNATKDIVFVQTCMNHNSPITTRKYIRGNQDEKKIQASDIMAKLTLE